MTFSYQRDNSNDPLARSINVSSGLPKKRTTKAKPQSQSDDEGGISLVALYAGTAIVGGILIAGIGIYLALPSVTQMASVTAAKVLQPTSVIHDAHDLIVTSINLELGDENWRELEFDGPFPAEPMRLVLLERLAGQPGLDKYAQPDAGACIARLLINIKAKSGKPGGRDFRIYWIASNRSVRHIASTELVHDILLPEIEKAKARPAP